MNKNGFTLIELLAIICVLGLIAMIAVPSVNNIIKSTNESAFKNDLTTIEKAVKIYLSETEDVDMENFRIPIEHLKLSIKNKSDYSGIIFLDNDVVNFENLKNENFCANGNIKNLEIKDASEC